jgi:transcription antitermination factor NusG
MAVKEEEIKIIKRVTMEDDLDVDVVPTTLSEGDPVEISAGSLIGMKGKIVKKDGKRKFQVELESLGMSMFITIDGAFLEKMGGAVSPG